jgi:2-polyprenyl-3-methyl-5-hydroxy-6-metoxy-1,4-benzoquinol methylase
MTQHPDTAFAKYDESGAYHWREIGTGLISHNAFTAERYRRVIAAMGPLAGTRVLDYGCGDGAFLGFLARTAGRGAAALHGFDPTPAALRLAEPMLKKHGVEATLHATMDDVPDEYFDRVACTEVIEHASDPQRLLREIVRVLKPGGEVVLTTPIRLTDRPADANHVHEWFVAEFAALLGAQPLQVLRHEEIIPAAAPEVYFWRPPVFARVPVFRLMCNVLSICAGVNASSFLRVRPKLFMVQLLVARKPA